MQKVKKNYSKEKAAEYYLLNKEEIKKGIKQGKKEYQKTYYKKLKSKKR